MTTTKWSATVVVFALLGAMAGYGWGQYKQAHPDKRGIAAQTASSSAVEADRRVLYWHDPMKPEVKFDKPGKSPFMDMQLVPVYDNDAPSEGGIRVSAAAQQNLGIRLGRVQRKVMVKDLTAVGTVAYDENEAVVVQARVAGYVSRLRVKAALDRVHRGQVLAEVAAPEWIEAEGEYLALLGAPSAGAAALHDAARARLLVLGIPDAAIAELEKTRAVPEATPLYAPDDGVIAELGVREGASFTAGSPLFRINGLSTVWINAQVPESVAERFSPGSVVATRSISWPGQVFAGHVVAALPQIDAMTRTRIVRIAVNNRDERLTPGMFVQSTFQDRAETPQLWVPSEAVIVTGTRNVVITQRNAGSFAAVDVTTGSELNGETAILAGLTAGDSVVLSGQFLIDSEASLKSTLARLSGTGADVPEVRP